jgi:Fibronectin type III-like domain/Glycosyl hydrolase family 3 N terminal domain
VKHYAANEQEYRRENINILVDERSWREVYLPPFEAAVKEGHAASVMDALNAVNGDFACESHYLYTQVLKRDWNFDGVLLSDYTGRDPLWWRESFWETTNYHGEASAWQSDDRKPPDHYWCTLDSLYRWHFHGLPWLWKNHIQPQYPFGYGLSYTKFNYSGLKITPSELSHDGDASVTFRITNIGQRAGAEVAQLYVGEENPRVARPIKELKGFTKVYLRPGESKQVTIKLNQRSLAFYNVQARAWEADPGAYAISVGASSQDIRLTGRLINPSLSMIPVSDSEPVAEFESDDWTAKDTFLLRKCRYFSPERLA